MFKLTGSTISVVISTERTISIYEARSRAPRAGTISLYQHPFSAQTTHKLTILQLNGCVVLAAKKADGARAGGVVPPPNPAGGGGGGGGPGSTWRKKRQDADRNAGDLVSFWVL